MKFLLKLSLLAKAITVIFLPPLVSLWLFIIFAFFSPFEHGTLPPLYSLFVGITFFTVLPLLTLILLARGHGTSFTVPRSSRFPSYLIVLCEYAIGTSIFYLDKNATIFFVIGIIYITIIGILMIINSVWKISVHSAGISGPATFCFYMFGISIWTFPLIVFIVLVIWARFHIQAHTLSQLFGGTLIASIITLIIAYLSF